MLCRLGALVLLTLAPAGCAGDDIDVTVDVLSDWVPGLDFVAVTTEISRQAFDETSGAEVRQESFRVSGTEDFLRGVRVAELGAVGEGRRFVRVILEDATGRTVAGRVLDLDLERSFAVTLLITRSCRDVACPAPAGAPELSECQAGECVDPRCAPSSPEFCPPPTCEDDGVCAEVLEWCDGARICGRSGHCLCDDAPVVPDGGVDGGVDAGDCAINESICDDGRDEDCDGLTDCADQDCLGLSCDDGFYCTSNDRCGADQACSDTEPTCEEFCSEATSSCEQCLMDADCGAPSAGAWGSCGGFAGTCGEAGMRTRMVMTPRCDTGACVVDAASESEACTRDTDGTSCMARTIGSWGGCGGFSDGCDTTGTQSRTITTYTCASGSCGATSGSESQGCTRTVPAHTTCGANHLRCCGGSCVDIRNDRNNCGGCGLACNSGFNCGSRGGLPTCQCSGPHATCSGSTGSCSASTLLCSCDPTYGGSCPGPMRCYAMSGGADVCTY